MSRSIRFIALFVLVTSCAGPPGSGRQTIAVTVRVAPSSGTVDVEMEGDFGTAQGRRLWMANGAVGNYMPADFTPFVDGLRAWNGRGAPLDVERLDGGWQLGGEVGRGRFAYRVDVHTLTVQLDASVASLLNPEGGFLFGYGLFVMAEGSQDHSCRVRLELPSGWRAAWSLPQGEDGSFRADNFFQLLDEPLLVGTAFRSLRVEEAVPERLVHAYTDGSVDAGEVAEKLASAARESARALEALGTPQSTRPYHIFFTVREPRADERLGWALEHGQSFHCVAAPDMLEWPSARLIYHLLHHELHAWMPRRLYTDRLHPRRLWRGGGSAFVWFAEGFPQYLASCAMAKSGAVGREQALAMLARRFAGPYLALKPQQPMAMTELSERLASGDHQHWFYGFAGGGLLAMMIDQQMRARDAKYGLLEAMLALSDGWIDHAQGIPEEEFERVFSEAVGFDAGPLFARHVRGSERLPVEEILAGAGIVPAAAGGSGAIWGDTAGFEVLAEEKVDEAVRNFRRAAF